MQNRKRSRKCKTQKFVLKSFFLAKGLLIFLVSILNKLGWEALAHFELNESSFYSSYVIDAHARLHPNG